MGANTKIEWANHTFNPWIGCTKISPGCDHCYAEAMSKRTFLVEWGQGKQRKRTSAANWELPIKWDNEAKATGVRKRVFCASLADVFDNEVPKAWRRDLFELIGETPNLDWLLLTKRIGNAQDMMNAAVLDDGREWPWPNVWLGATICNQVEANRDIPKLLSVAAGKRFLSIEPMLGQIDLSELLNAPCQNFRGNFIDPETGLSECCKACDYTGIDLDRRIDWVICGGESGPGARPMHPDWARSLRDQCANAGVAFMFKQWGHYCHPTQMPDECRGSGSFIDDFFPVGKKAAGRLLDGVEHNAVAS